MKKLTLKFIIKTIVILSGLFALIFQSYQFLFTTLSMPDNGTYAAKDWFYYNTLPHFITILICIWFLIYQIWGDKIKRNFD